MWFDRWNSKQIHQLNVIVEREKVSNLKALNRQGEQNQMCLRPEQSGSQMFIFGAPGEKPAVWVKKALGTLLELRGFELALWSFSYTTSIGGNTRCVTGFIKPQPAILKFPTLSPINYIHMQPICVRSLYSVAPFSIKHCHTWDEINLSSQTRLHEWGVHTNRLMTAGVPTV